MHPAHLHPYTGALVSSNYTTFARYPFVPFPHFSTSRHFLVLRPLARAAIDRNNKNNKNNNNNSSCSSTHTHTRSTATHAKKYTMQSFTTLLAIAASLATASAQTKGFNYGSTQTDGSIKYQADFQSEFAAAKGLVGASGFTSARLYTTIVSDRRRLSRLMHLA